jgi:hypothetical protein
MSGQIFISYRRDDASHPAGRLYDHLAQKFPKSRIFMDIDDLDPGEDFVEALKKSVGSCDILIAIIGRHWVDACDADRNCRLHNPGDFVRLEISTALKRGILVMPVLVDGAVMPGSTSFPRTFSRSLAAKRSTLVINVLRLTQRELYRQLIVRLRMQNQRRSVRARERVVARPFRVSLPKPKHPLLCRAKARHGQSHRCA